MGKSFSDYQEVLDTARAVRDRIAGQHGSATGLVDALTEDKEYAFIYGKLVKEIEKMERYAAQYDRNLIERQLGNVTDATSRVREYLQ